jgi:amidase
MSQLSPTIADLLDTARRARIAIGRSEAEALQVSVQDLLASFRAVEDHPPVRSGRAEPSRATLTATPCTAQRRDVAITQPGPSVSTSRPWQHRYQIEERVGPLTGMTVAVKDCIAIAGVPMSLGLRDVHYRPRCDAAVIRKLLNAGARLVGTSTCEALCLSGGSHTAATGPLSNPWDPDRSSGGSSSGSAVLAALGAVDIAIGTDQGGSVRIPGAWCGVYGLKPTWGAVPYDGAFSLHPRLDHIGLLARDPRRLADAWAALRSRSDQPDGCSLGRVALLREGFGRPESERDVDVHVYRLADQLTRLGATVEEASVPLHDSASDAVRILALVGLADLLHGPGDNAGPLVGLASLITSALGVPDRPVTVVATALAALCAQEGGLTERAARAHALGDQASAAYDEVLARADAILLPTVPMKATPLPPPGASPSQLVRLGQGASRNTAPFNLTGHPAITVPCPTAGLPVGAMLVARHGADDLLVRFASSLEHSPP